MTYHHHNLKETLDIVKSLTHCLIDTSSFSDTEIKSPLNNQR